ncbi:MAG: hypothetical protein WDN04_21665 [Rhodospirillales bacterium]
MQFCHITSPIEGVVGLRLVDIGNLIHATDTTGIVTITQVHPISLVFTLPESEFPRVRAAMQAAGSGPWPAGAGLRQRGRQAALQGHAADPEQQHRHHDRHHRAEGDVR